MRRILCILFLFGLASCAPRPEPPLRVATNVWPGYEPLYLARSLGLYDKAPIRLVEMTSASEVANALRDGTVEAGALTLDETLTLIQDGIDLRVVLVMDVSHGADALLVHPGVADLQALRGKRVGVENGAVGALMLDAVLQAGDLSEADVRMVPLTVNEHVEAWRRGRVDALVTFEPVRTELMQEGAVDLFNSSRIPGRIVDVLAVRAEVITRHRSALASLLSGHFAALDHLARQPRDAALRMAPRLALPHDLVLQQFRLIQLPSLEENRHWLSGNAPRLHASATVLAELMLRRQLLQRSIGAVQLAEPVFLSKPAQ